MNNRSIRQETGSKQSRSYPHRDTTEITVTVRWIAWVALILFITLDILYLATGSYNSAIAASIGIIPVLMSLRLLNQVDASIPSPILSVTIILLITWLATFGQGIYDIGILGYPVILIVAGLILRGRVIGYLTVLIIACMAWLIFGDLFNVYTPIRATSSFLEDFFIGSIIIFVAGNAVFRLVTSMNQNLSRAEEEIINREEAEKELETVIQQLKRKNKELDRFAIRVSHDLKSPLITLAGFLGYLEKDIDEGNYEKAVKDFSQINGAAKTMGKFVDELLDLSRVGRIINPPTDVSFEKIVLDTLKATDGLLRSKQVQVKVDANFPLVHVDRPRIVQVMQNLIVNAVKFMGDQSNPTITIGYEELNGKHVFSVQDNGIGISTEYHESIFELFNKLDPDMDGTGLGLGLVKKIIEVHNGRIWVESEPGQGSKFRFTLAAPGHNV